MENFKSYIGKEWTDKKKKLMWIIMDDQFECGVLLQCNFNLNKNE